MSDNLQKAWWRNQEKDLHLAVVAFWNWLESKNSSRRSKHATWLSLYEGRQITSLDTDAWDKWITSDVIKLNVISSILDSLIAELATTKTRAMFLTSDGNWRNRKRGRGLTYLAEGIFEDQGVYDEAPEIIRDALMWENGILKIWPDFQQNRVRCERVICDEISVSPIDGRYRKPRSICEHRVMGRAHAAEVFRVDYADLKEAALLRGASGSVADDIDEPISILEAFHLPSVQGGSDGRHVVSTSNRTLVVAPWKTQHLPYAVLRYENRPIGWHGMSLVEQLQPIQDEILFGVRKVQLLLNQATARIWEPAEAEIDGDGAYTNNTDIPVNRFKGGQPPIMLADTTVPPQLFNWIWELYGKAYELAGISQMFAAAQKPAGLNSGEAQRVYKENQSKRFLAVAQRIDSWYCHQVARLCVESARQLAEKDPGWQVTGRGERNRKIFQIRWKDVAVDEADYQIMVMPTGFLPRDPAGRLQSIKELGQTFPSLMVSAAEHLDYPDIDALMSNVSAPARSIDSQIDRILDGEIDVRPLPFMDPVLAGQRALAARLRADDDGAPEEILDELTAYLIACSDLLKKAQEPAQMPGTAPGGIPLPGPLPAPAMPPGAPGMPPIPGAM
jgi:hypothetical protein